MLALTALLVGGLTVTLPDAVTVKGSEIELAEVAQLSGDPALVTRARELSLGWAPAPGYQRTLHAAQVARRIRTALAGIDLTVAGSVTCKVEPEVQLVTSAQIEAAARGLLGERAGGRDLELLLLEQIEPVTIPVPEHGLEVVARLDRALLSSGPVQVPVELRVDGLPWRTVWTRWEAGLWADRLVLARDVQRGEVLTVHDLRRERVRLGAAQEAAAGKLEAVALDGAVALRDLTTGSVVSAGDVRRPVAVARGTEVTVELVKGPITASSLGTALESAAVGERIQVSLAGGTRTVQAQVIRRGLVRLVLQ
jgi:flagella basal body P-ring formation protein FlgA